jgi:hypothetical protein
MTGETFRTLVEKAFQMLPAKLRAEADGIPLLVQDGPPPNCPATAELAIIQSPKGLRLEVYQRNFNCTESTDEQVCEHLRRALEEDLSFYFET